MEEQWRPVPGYEGWYSVSNIGRVRRDRGGKGTLPGRVKHLRKSRHGRYYVDLYKGSRAVHRRFYAYQLVAAAFIGPRPEGHLVNHKDGKPANDVLGNLEYLTQSEDSKHAYALGLRVPTGVAVNPLVGSERPAAKLDEAQVRQIRALRGTMGEAAVGARFGISSSHAGNLMRGRFWRHISEDSKEG